MPTAGDSQTRSQNHFAQHTRVNTELTSKDRTVICNGKVSPSHSEPLSHRLGEVAAHEKATEFSSVCHFFSCSKRDKINVTLKKTKQRFQRDKKQGMCQPEKRDKKLSPDSLSILEISSRATVASRISPLSLFGTILNQ